MIDAQKAGGMRRTGVIIAAGAALLLVWAWWDGGEQSLVPMEHPVDLPPELSGDLAEGQ